MLVTTTSSNLIRAYDKRSDISTSWRRFSYIFRTAMSSDSIVALGIGKMQKLDLNGENKL